MLFLTHMDEASPENLLLKNKEIWFIPAAIVVAGAILAITTYSFRHKALVETSVKGDITLMRPVGPIDHIVGNPSAPVMLVEYSDIDSAYSKSFQATMEQLMTEYAPGSKVAWVYRHLPLIDQHPNSASHAEAAECVNSLGGQTMFYRFIDSLQAKTPASGQFNPRDYKSVVTSLGLDNVKFTECLTNHTFQNRVSADFANGLAIGAGGSPFSVLLIKGQEPVTIDGAIPYDAMKKILDKAIGEVK